MAVSKIAFETTAELAEFRDRKQAQRLLPDKVAEIYTAPSKNVARLRGIARQIPPEEEIAPLLPAGNALEDRSLSGRQPQSLTAWFTIQEFGHVRWRRESGT
jgi:hypothetical protein